MKAEPKPKKEAQPNVPVGQRVQREVIAWFWVALVFLLINGTIGQARVIPSGSMENTLLIGDHLIMSRIGYDAGGAFHQLACAVVAQSASPAGHYFQAAFCAGYTGLRQARYRPAGRFH